METSRFAANTLAEEPLARRAIKSGYTCVPSPLLNGPCPAFRRRKPRRQRNAHRAWFVVDVVRDVFAVAMASIVPLIRAAVMIMADIVVLIMAVTV